MMENRNILIGVTGSVAAIKIGEIVDKLLSDTTFKFEVSRSVLTVSEL